MGLIGEMLVERGAISAEQLQQGLVASRRGGRRLGTYLMDLGFIDEGALLEVLAVQQGVPFISEAALLEHLERFEAPLLPESMLRRLRAVPFRVVRDRIQVAMSSPGDAGVIDRIANFTQLHVEPFVASDRTIERAIEKAPRLREVEKTPDEDLLTEIVHVEDDAEAWDELWAPQLRPAGLLQTHSRPKAARVVLVASFPDLETVGSGSNSESLVADDKELLRHLATVANAAEVGEALVRFASQHLDRVCLFAVHNGSVSGWLGRGLMAEAAGLRSFQFAEKDPSLFHQLGEHDDLVTQLAAGPVNNRLLELLGTPPPTEVFVTAIRVQGRIKALLLGDVPGCRVPETVRSPLAAASRAAGEALTRVLAARA